MLLQIKFNKCCEKRQAFLPIPDPNGQDIFHKPASRVGDGRLIVDFIAEHLGLPYLSAYLNSLDANFRHGSNFATGGSTIRRQNETIFENGIIEVGYQDLLTSRGLSTHLIYNRGARTFWIHNTVPIGCLPVNSFYIRNPKLGFLDQFGCIRGHDDMAIEFNRQLKDRVTTLRAELPLAAITYVDIYTSKYNLISSTKVQGFMDPLKICCTAVTSDRNGLNSTERDGIVEETSANAEKLVVDFSREEQVQTSEVAGSDLVKKNPMMMVLKEKVVIVPHIS
ncbi:hypothetical protein POM88_027705 [Heracleum sosnowskyi]|uniref:Uncharacterized protein n=1 Tax=Heracleum sosnowskyi TaxID=360622 RepID=A0AAD8I8G1_9APIA|nr:hypothetical protein POM88_027705 [Heracleum sosnowskyi]